VNWLNQPSQGPKSRFQELHLVERGGDDRDEGEAVGHGPRWFGGFLEWGRLHRSADADNENPRQVLGSIPSSPELGTSGGTNRSEGGPLSSQNLLPGDLGSFFPPRDPASNPAPGPWLLPPSAEGNAGHRSTRK
jgi:hypothetical protein